MDFHIQKVLEQAQRDERFEHVDCQYLELLVSTNETGKPVKVHPRKKTLTGITGLTEWLEKEDVDGPKPVAPKLAGLKVLGGLRLLIQSSIHKDHGFGKPDKISFDNPDVFRKMVKILKLPQSYILALDHSKGVAECCPTDPESTNAKLDFIAQDIMYHDDAWSLALSHDPETGITTGFFRADGKTDEDALIKHLRAPERAIDIDGMIKYSKEPGRKLDVDTVLEYLKLETSKPCTNPAGVVKFLKAKGNQLNMRTIDKHLKFWGFRKAFDEPSNNSNSSGSILNADPIARFQKSSELQYDLDIITKDLNKFRKKIDVEAILKYLKDSKEQILHPMLLPAIMYQSLKVSSDSHLKDLHGLIHGFEVLLKHVKVRQVTAAPNDGPVEDQEIRDEAEKYQTLSQHINSSKKDQASRDGRHQFRRQFQTSLQKAVESVNSSARSHKEKSAPALQKRAEILKNTGDQIEQWISYNTRIFEFEEGRDVNYRARIEAQLSLLYHLMSQRQRSLQEKIAQSTGKDSGDMKYIAFLGSFFLPANLVAAMFAVKEWQLKDWELFKFLLTTIVFVALVFVVLCYKQLKYYGRWLLGCGPAPNESSASKSRSLDWGSVDRSRTTSVSSQDLA